MVEQNPWKTPFGKVLIGAGIVATAAGFALAAGAAGYFKSSSSSVAEMTEEAPGESLSGTDVVDTTLDASPSADVTNDREGYSSALEELGPESTDFAPSQEANPVPESTSEEQPTETTQYADASEEANEPKVNAQ